MGTALVMNSTDWTSMQLKRAILWYWVLDTTYTHQILQAVDYFPLVQRNDRGRHKRKRNINNRMLAIDHRRGGWAWNTQVKRARRWRCYTWTYCSGPI